MTATEVGHLTPVGRFAPSPSGRMHLGNLYTALISWLSVKSRKGKWILRIEDLDPQRSKPEYAKLIEEDLRWLGLEWDEGGLDNKGDNGPYSQSQRTGIYADALSKLQATGLTYPCYCTRADIMATQAPHQSDGRVIYSGRCRPQPYTTFQKVSFSPGAACRIIVPDREYGFDDIFQRHYRANLSQECGDFILQRKDGAFAYQLAVVVDDAMMGVTEVIRGNDLLLSTCQQLYLYELLGFAPPQFGHLPLLCNPSGQRLSKRDESLSMERLRLDYSPEALLGQIAFLCGLKTDNSATNLPQLLELYSPILISNDQILINR